MAGRLTDLKECAVPQPSSKLNDNISSGTQFVNVTHKVVALHVGPCLTVLNTTHQYNSTRPTQPCSPLGSVQENQLWLGRQMHAWQVKLDNVLAAVFYPTLCANYIPDSYRLAGTVEAGLWKCRFGRSSDLRSLPTSVGDERGSTAYSWCTSHRPHLGCTHHPPLAPSPGEGIVQDGHAKCTRPVMEPHLST